MTDQELRRRIERLEEDVRGAKGLHVHQAKLDVLKGEVGKLAAAREARHGKLVSVLLLALGAGGLGGTVRERAVEELGPGGKIGPAQEQAQEAQEGRLRAIENAIEELSKR